MKVLRAIVVLIFLAAGSVAVAADGLVAVVEKLRQALADIAAAVVAE